MPNILAILGPSGVGKSCLCKTLTTDDSFLHIEFDGNHPWESQGFPPEWDRDLSQVDFALVASIVRNQVDPGSRDAAVLSFATIHVFTAMQLERARAEGIVPIILWGTEDQCIAARIERSKKHRVRFNTADQVRYRRTNRDTFKAFSSSRYAAYRVEAFRPDGGRWPPEHLPDICKKRMAG